MKYNVLVHLWLTCVWRPMRNGSWKKPNVYRKAACRSYRFLWPLFSLWSSISLSDFQLGVFLLLQCINLSNFHVLSVLKRKYNFMYLVDCRCVKRRAVLHKIHMPLFGFTDVHQKKTSLTSSTAGCRSCPNCNQNSKSRKLYCPPFTA